MSGDAPRRPIEDSPLGREIPLPERYDPSLLFTVERADARAAIGVAVEQLTEMGARHLRVVAGQAGEGLPLGERHGFAHRSPSEAGRGICVRT